MRDKPWAVIDLMDPDAATVWYATEGEAIVKTFGRAVSIQYRPGRKAKVKKDPA